MRNSEVRVLTCRLCGPPIVSLSAGRAPSHVPGPSPVAETWGGHAHIYYHAWASPSGTGSGVAEANVVPSATCFVHASSGSRGPWNGRDDNDRLYCVIDGAAAAGNAQAHSYPRRKRRGCEGEDFSDGGCAVVGISLAAGFAGSWPFLGICRAESGAMTLRRRI